MRSAARLLKRDLNDLCLERDVETRAVQRDVGEEAGVIEASICTA